MTRRESGCRGDERVVEMLYANDCQQGSTKFVVVEESEEEEKNGREE